MAEETSTSVSNTTSSRGAQWATAGSVIALAAQSLLNGGVGNLLGGGNSSTVSAATEAAIELAKKDAEIALLKAGTETDKKLVDVYTELRTQDKAQDAKIAAIDNRVTTLEATAPLREQIVLGQVQSVATAATNGISALSSNLGTQIAAINSTLSGITKNIVPASAVCPQPMPLYNAWKTPTDGSDA